VTLRPDHSLDQSVIILPQYRDRDPGGCSAAILERRCRVRFSGPALTHKPTKATRREFDWRMRAVKGERQEAFDRSEKKQSAWMAGEVIE
jgi:hypothetical protein